MQCFGLLLGYGEVVSYEAINVALTIGGAMPATGSERSDRPRRVEAHETLAQALDGVDGVSSTLRERLLAELTALSAGRAERIHEAIVETIHGGTIDG